MKPLKLRTKLTAGIIFLVLFFGLLAAFCTYSITYNRLENLHHNKDLLLVKAIAGVVIPILIVGNILIFIFTTRLTRPISELIKTVKAISKGDFTKQFHIKTHDEIGELAIAFNTMIRHIKKSQEALAESEKRFRQIVENSEEWIWEVNKEGLYTYSSPVIKDILGYQPSELVGKKYFYDFFHPHDKEELKNKTFDVFKQRGKFNNFLNRNIHKDGRIAWLSTSGIPIFNEEGEFYGYRGVDTDITERRNREIELQWHADTQVTINSILRLSLDNTIFDEFLRRALTRILAIPWLFIESKGAIFLLDNDTKYLMLKAQYDLPKQILDSCEKVAPGKCLCGQTAKTGKIQFLNRLDKQHTKNCENITPHGQYCVPIKYANKLIGVITVYVEEGHRQDQKEEDALMAIADALAGVIIRKRAEDALEDAFFQLKQTQNQLIQAEKMQAVGRLASGIAHEVKNPLATILTATEYLSISLDDNKEASETINEILKAVERADNIIKGLLNFSRATKLELETKSLNSIIHNVLILMDNQFRKHHIKIITNYAKDLPLIEADINKIDQVFINIFMNAIYAMPEGGALSTETYTKKLNQRAEGVGLRKNDPFKLGESVVIVEIQDTGCGIPKDKLNKIFDPFFTTRRTNGGTGLGLSIIKNIIAMHNAMIKIENKTDGRGALVTLTFKIKEKAI